MRYRPEGMRSAILDAALLPQVTIDDGFSSVLSPTTITHSITYFVG